jgi:hypothetical protein
MKLLSKLAVATLALLTTSIGPAFADILTGTTVTGNPVSHTGQASVTVVEPITITYVEQMTWGYITAGAVAGDLSVSTTHVLTDPPGGPVAIGGGPPSAVRFTVTGAGGNPHPYTLTSSSSATLTGPGAPIPLTVTAPSPASGVGGPINVTIGGTITVGAGQAPGDYFGTVTLTAEYQ